MAKYIPLNDDLNDYVQSISAPDNNILHDLRVETAALTNGHMQIPADQGAFFSFLLKAIVARRVLEIGVFTGYSSLVAALAIPADGQVVALDMSEAYTDIARRYWEKAGVAHKIDLRLGLALDTLHDLGTDPTQWFDFTFIDADKANLNEYYELTLNMTRRGGIIAIDNALRSGKVLAPHTDDDARHLHELNQKARQDKRVDATLLTIGDGVLLIRRR